jgi:16S rRNA A1518/A1519 N6-dimethyltransferase RsmA/KsgA/DIM1 with predicted DNA glycosylase/AP lyase activity
MGLFSANVKVIKTNEDDITQLKREEKMLNIYFNHMRRLRANSFREFLEDMLESPKHFTNTKMENEEFFKAVSINQSQLIDIYYAYCTKQGYRPRSIDEELNLL